MNDVERFSTMQLELMIAVGAAIAKAEAPGGMGHRGEALTKAEVAEALEWKLRKLGFRASVIE